MYFVAGVVINAADAELELDWVIDIQGVILLVRSSIVRLGLGMPLCWHHSQFVHWVPTTMITPLT